MHVLEPGWEVPDALPAGVTLAPAADPIVASRVIAERIGGEVVVDVAAAERALAREAARRRARDVIADAAEAALLCARLDELSSRIDTGAADRERSATVARLSAVAGDITADPDVLVAAAARLRAAAVTADASARIVGDRPSTVPAEMELVRARSMVSASADAADDPERGHTEVAGVVAMSSGAALVLVGTGVPAAVAVLVPVGACAALVTRWRSARNARVRSSVDADAAATALDRANAAWARAAHAEREWQARVDAAAAADAELAAAREAWIELVGGDTVPVERAEHVADARRRLIAVATELGVDPATPAAQLTFALSRRAADSAAASHERDEVHARLRQLLHGRRLDRLRAEADAARHLLASPAPRAIVLCDPFAAVGRHRRRELFEDLERAAPGMTLAVVTSDDDALAWAAARNRVEIG
jgi:hypothetical protein